MSTYRKATILEEERHNLHEVEQYLNGYETSLPRWRKRYKWKRADTREEATMLEEKGRYLWKGDTRALPA